MKTDICYPEEAKTTKRSYVRHHRGLSEAAIRMHSRYVNAVAFLSYIALLVPAGAVPHWFIGERVVCVNNRFLDLSDAPELVEGRTYTIVDIWPARRGHLGLEVAEAGAKPQFLAFDERRFIPAATTATKSEPAHLRLRQG